MIFRVEKGIGSQVFRCQCSAQPPAKKTASQIEKEILLEPNEFNNGNL